ELEAELLEDTPGALWSHASIEASRLRLAPEMTRVVVAIDPAVMQYRIEPCRVFGHQLVPDPEKAAHREDYCSYGRMIQSDQYVFNLPDGSITSVDLAPDQFARPGASHECRIINAKCWRGHL